MKFWSRLRWFAAFAFLALLLWSWWSSNDATWGGETESSRPGIFNF